MWTHQQTEWSMCLAASCVSVWSFPYTRQNEGLWTLFFSLMRIFRINSNFTNDWFRYLQMGARILKRRESWFRFVDRIFKFSSCHDAPWTGFRVTQLVRREFWTHIQWQVFVTSIITTFLLGHSRSGAPFREVFSISVALSLGAVLWLSIITLVGSETRVVGTQGRKRDNEKKLKTILSTVLS